MKMEEPYRIERRGGCDVSVEQKRAKINNQFRQQLLEEMKE